MAGASSSSGGSFKYDVFINFRGEDTRRGFVCHLCNALKQKAVDVFIDSEELRKGDDLSELLQAIRDSRLSIVVFSKDYASSTWCLKELVQIMECMGRGSQIVVPIFYEVDPSHVRKLKESFAGAFAKHESDSNIDKEESESWKSSLTRATNLSGWDSKSYRDDIELIGSIVEDILKKLIDSKTDGLIGMDSRVDEIDSLLAMEVDDIRIVGIWGMGGIGKSTIARAVYEKIAPQFEHSCFLDNVKEAFITKHGAAQMVEELLSRILKVNDLRTLDGGLNMMRERLFKKRILLVLDDVDNLHQIETLIGEKPSFGHGSRIIITTRDKKLLGGCLIYEPKLFTNEEAFELFSRHAFKTNKYSDIYDAISRRAIKYAHGLPLALKVLGALLVNRTTVQEWKYELEKIEKIPITFLDDKIRHVLWASYDRLDRYQKNIFLDIACFFNRDDTDFVTKFHESCGFSPQNGLRVLAERSLVTVSGDGKLEMLDLIQDLGRDIVHRESSEDPGMRSRLWAREDVLQVLAQNTATEVEGIYLDLSELKKVYINGEVFVSMRRLRLLQITGHVYNHVGASMQKTNDEPYVQCMSENLKFLSNELRVLVWHGCPLKSFPINFQPKNLIYVNMCYSRIEQLWEGTKPLRNLVYLDLSYSKYLIKTPDFTEATNLEKLNLAGCTSLLEVHPSISALKSLVELDLRGCTNLKKFPNISRNMKELSELYLDETAITELPSSINDISRLQTLSLAGCRELRSLPRSIHMKSLVYLNLSGCSKLTEFPEISEVMEELRKLKLDGTAIKELPSSINNLAGLGELNLTNCTNLVCLPDNICNLAWLDHLYLTGCSNLSKLPENFGNLRSLWQEDSCLELQGSGIKQLPFSILCGLSLSCNGCKEMTAPFSSWPTWNHQNPSYSVLLQLDLSDCNLLELSDGIAHLSSLYELDLSGNKKLESLPAAMNRLGNLRFLYLRGCKTLKSIPELSSRIQEINAQDCTSLETFSAPQPPYAENICLAFSNCFKLVINTCRFKLLRIFTDIVERATDNQDYKCRMSLPGSDIPFWFNHQGRGSSVTVQLPPNLLANKFLGFAICAISNLRRADNRKPLEPASCCCTLKANDGHQDNLYFPLLAPFLGGTDGPHDLDHMLLGYTNFRSLGGWHNERKYTEARFRIMTEKNLKSRLRDGSTRLTFADCTWITSCGVRLFPINPPSSVNLISDLENRETEIRSKGRKKH